MRTGPEKSPVKTLSLMVRSVEVGKKAGFEPALASQGAEPDPKWGAGGDLHKEYPGIENSMGLNPTPPQIWILGP